MENGVNITRFNLNVGWIFVIYMYVRSFTYEYYENWDRFLIK